MKKCPFCAEEIQNEAIKCRYCGEFLDKSSQLKPKKKWHQSTSFIVIALLCVGPFALPLVWLNHKYNIAIRIAVTVVVIILTVVLSYVMADLYRQVTQQISELGIRY